MKISSVQQTSFCGIPISDISIIGSKAKYKLYNVSDRDAKFLSDMYDSVKLEKLMPNLSDLEYYLWDSILQSAIDVSKLPLKRAFIETYNNIPCGVMCYSTQGKNMHVNFVVTFPDKVSHRVPCAGQILFNELFRRFIISDSQKIELNASRYSPFDPVSKYLKLGFSMLGGDNYSEVMRIRKENVLNTLEKQKQFINVTPLYPTKEVDLSKIILLNEVV